MKNREKTNYISNKEFLKELKRFDETQIFSKRLHELFYILAQRIARKPCWYAKICNMNVKDVDIEKTKEELIHEGYFKCISKVESFDIKNRNNPFSYFTTVIHNAYRDYFALSYRQDILKMIAKKNYNHRFLLKYGFKPVTMKEENE